MSPKHYGLNQWKEASNQLSEEKIVCLQVRPQETWTLTEAQLGPGRGFPGFPGARPEDGRQGPRGKTRNPRVRRLALWDVGGSWISRGNIVRGSAAPHILLLSGTWTPGAV